MNALPVIDRELRTQARLGFTYHLRVLGATASLLVCAGFGAKYGFSPRLGSALFGYLNFTLLASIWILVPLLTADCISRERREGTLGLLFLTPLKAREVVMAKGMVHGIRALTLLLSVLPIITISFLLGGVSWKEALMSAFMNLSSICWGLAAGLIASSLSKTWVRSLLLAASIAGVFCIGFLTLIGTSILFFVRSILWLPFPFNRPIWEGRSAWTDIILPTGVLGATNFESSWQRMFGTLSYSGQRVFLLGEAGVVVISALVLLAAVLVAAWSLRRLWQEEPPSARVARMEAVFCTPLLAVGFYHRWMRRKLERNPIGWLEQRTWSGRSVMWGWLAVMVSFYSAFFYAPNADRMLGEMQDFMAWSLLCLMAVSAAGSFQRERESRVLELLLVSPMSAGDLVSGRLRGLWGRFLPALVLMLCVWGYLSNIYGWQGNLNLAPFFCGGFVTIPVIGLYYSLKRMNFIGALLSTLFMGLLLPNILMTAAGFTAEHVLKPAFGDLELFSDSSYSVILFQIWIAVVLGGRLRRNLVERNFPFNKGAV